jgi:hypothetical protein
MGIDIYATWRNQTEGERDKQAEVWLSASDGGVGYLREAYQGEPYATRVLMPEAFDLTTYPKGAPIPAAVLRERLPQAQATVRMRQLLAYNEGAHSENTKVTLESFRDFVDLCEAKERANGFPCMIAASY